MDLTPQMIDAMEILDTKERILGEIIVWLKAKGYWEQCCKDIEKLNHLAHPPAGVIGEIPKPRVPL